MFGLFEFLKPHYTATRCGHKTKQKGKVVAFDEHTITKMPLNDEGSIDYCLECIGGMAIKCAWCGEVIFIGDPITLYSPGPQAGFFSSEEPSEAQKLREKEKFIVPDHAVIYREDPLVLVGCLRWKCADTGADRAGFWYPGEDGKGKVNGVPTPYELILASDGNSAVVISDASAVVISVESDMKEAMNPTTVPLERKKIT